ncbi:helix-turn-helix domain-containing protein [Psychroflexus maritimus]|uniref:Helix-turn-helix transcriptional regulator n=1 Tax=Psychroflexus maritimus TaxID=2714865 RepID=A0A967AD21_9FLAO|nr:helix-turn-helix transcriptional regulator [Psychroflexus maritimus]NGZ89455.1 helix-turn-helix transcriptional regulator [Psychroflexus maritimus]
MNSIASKIKEIRKSKGFSQEELAEKASVNLRTIQRIENGENQPRGTTLQLIASVLGLSVEDLNAETKPSDWHFLIKQTNQFILLLFVNFILIGILGFLTLDSNANVNSLVGAVLLSTLIPLFIVYLSLQMSDLERMLKFGFGYISYMIILVFLHGLPIGFTTGLIPCALISLFFLYFGSKLLKNKNNAK